MKNKTKLKLKLKLAMRNTLKRGKKTNSKKAGKEDWIRTALE